MRQVNRRNAFADDHAEHKSLIASSIVKIMRPAWPSSPALLPPWRERIGLPTAAAATAVAGAQFGYSGCSRDASARQQEPKRHLNDVATTAAYRLNVSEDLGL